MQLQILEQEGTNHLPAIVAALQRRFDKTKESNPLGFQDQFEQQLESHLLEVAAELGGTYRGQGVFSFIGHRQKNWLTS